MNRAQRVLMLEKGGEIFILCCQVGWEYKLLKTLIKWAGDEQINFDWLDARILKLLLNRQADGLLQKNTGG